MWYRKQRGSPPPTNQQIHRIDHNFQLRYALYFMGTITLGLIIIIVPIYFFLNQNYKIVMELADRHSPDLLSYLEQERMGMNRLLFAIGVGLFVFSGIVGLRIANRIVTPVKTLKKHLEQITKGRWSIPEIKSRESDEFQDMTESYNAFYRSLRHNLKVDLQRLRLLKVDPLHNEAYKNWKTMIEEKALRLNKKDLIHPPTSSSDEVETASHDSLDAS